MPCPLGTYASATQESCIPCPAGTYGVGLDPEGNDSDTFACEACPPLYVALAPGSTSCDPCQDLTPNTYGIDGVTCVECPPGELSEGHALSAPHAKTKGTPTAKRESFTSDAMAGSYTETTGNITLGCTPCPEVFDGLGGVLASECMWMCRRR
jgi:hypothetical protein